MSEQCSVKARATQQTVSGSGRRWRIATVIGVLLALAAGVLAFVLFPPLYEASALIQIKEEVPYIVLEPLERPSERFVQTQVELIRSPMVLRPVVSQPEIARLPDLQDESSPVEWLAEKIQVEGVGTSELCRIAFSSSEQSSVALVVNAVVESYFHLRGEQEAEQFQTVITLLEEERRRQTGKVEHLRKEVRHLAEHASGIDSPLGGTTQDVDLLAELRSLLITAELEQVVLKMQAKLFEELAGEGQLEVPLTMVEAAVREHEKIDELETALAVKQAKLQQIKAASALEDKSPDYLQFAEEVNRDRETLQLVRKELHQLIAEKMKQDLIDKRRSEWSELRASINGYRIQEELLQKRYNEELQKVKQSSGDTVELEFKQEELERAGQILDMIAIRTLELDDRMRAPARVILLRPAEEPTAPIQWIPYGRMGVASLGGFCLPLMLLGLSLGVTRLFKRKELQDPVFGRLRYYPPEVWHGEVMLGAIGEIGVVVCADETGPTEAARQAFLEFQRRFPDLKPILAEALFGLYQDYQSRIGDSNAEQCLPQLSAAEDIWSHTQPEGIRIEASSDETPPQLMLACSFDWDENHITNLFIRDWKVDGVMVVDA